MPRRFTRARGHLCGGTLSHLKPCLPTSFSLMQFLVGSFRNKPKVIVERTWTTTRCLTCIEGLVTWVACCSENCGLATSKDVVDEVFVRAVEFANRLREPAAVRSARFT